MKTVLKKITNTLTVATTLFLLAGLGYVLLKNLPVSDLISPISFCYVSIAAFNYLMFGAATLWHNKRDM